MNYRDAISGAVCLAIGLVLSGWSAGYRIGTITKPGPGFFPLGLGLLLILLSLILLSSQFRGSAVRERAELPAFLPGWKKVVYVVLVLLFSGLLLERIGALITFFLLVIFAMRGAAGQQGWKKSVLTALLTTVAIYIVFVLLLKQQLPHGFLGV